MLDFCGKQTRIRRWPSPNYTSHLRVFRRPSALKLVDFHIACVPNNRYRILTSHDLLDAIFGTIRLKSTKLLSADWRTAKTILIVQLMDYAFESFAWMEDTTLSDECAEFGFEEIWIADYSTLEPYCQLRLVGLNPRDYFGLHCQPALERNPYG